MAHRRLVAKLDYSTIAFQFMGETFTLSELQSVYETLLNQPIDKRNFRKRILSLGLIEATGEQRRNGKHRPARVYRVKHPDRVEIIK
jgi:8-oxo-dGTP diphosphatase